MGFIGWLLNLFGIGKKTAQQQEQAETVGFSGLDSWLVASSEKDTKKLLDDSLPKLSEIKHLLREISLGLEDLSKKQVEGSEEQNENARLRKIVGTSKGTFAEHMKQLLGKLSPPAMPNFDSVSQYSLAAWPLLEREINAFGKSIAYTSIVLKDEVKGIGSNIQELQSLLKGLFESFSQNPNVSSGVQTKKFSETIKQKLSEKTLLETETKEISAVVEKLRENILALEKKLAAMRDSEEFKALELLESQKRIAIEKKENLRAELFGLLAPVDKQFRRFEALVDSGSIAIAKAEKEFLKLFLRDPLLALKQDPRADTLKKILLKLQQAIADGKVSVKEEEKEKRSVALASLVGFDFFSNFFWKSNQIEVELQKAEKELSHNNAMQEKNALEREMESEKKSLEAKAKEFSFLQKKKQALDTAISETIVLLEKLAEKVSGKKIKIEF